MFKIKKSISPILLVCLSLTLLFSSPAEAKNSQPPIHGKYGIAIDAATGDILYQKNADKQAYPASITKILTAIILDEKVSNKTMLTVSANAAGQECICFGLKAGEQISKKDAMYGMLLLSANDLAVTVAENVGGSVQGFAKLMNNEVEKLGLNHTHFVTPNGLHDPDHYTTAHDMALIMKEALKHPDVLDALSTQSILVHTSLQDKMVANTSDVHTQPKSAHVIAGKNGYTEQAGHTLVELLKDGDKEVIAVVMKTNKKSEYQDIQTMANYAFVHLKTKTFALKGKTVKKIQINGENVDLIAAEDLKVTIKSDEAAKFTTKIDFINNDGKEMKKGQIAAKLKILENGKILKEIPLVTSRGIPEKSTAFLGVGTILAAVLLIAMLMILLRMFKIARLRKRRKRNR